MKYGCFFLIFLLIFRQNAINQPFLHKIWTEEGFFSLMLPQNMQENSKNTPNISLPGGRSLIVTLYIISV